MSREPEHQLRVLIVDDEPLARQHLRRRLRSRPDFAVVAEAADGQAAIRAIEELRPDLVFLDIQMPGVGGIDVVRAIGPRSMPAVIFVTAFDQHALEAFEVNAVDYLLKPFDDDRFEESLNRVVSLLERPPGPGSSRARQTVDIQELEALAGLGETLKRLIENDPSAGIDASLSDASESSPPTERIAIRDRNKISLVEVEAIDWVEAEGNYVRLHTGSTSRLMRATLSRLTEQLRNAKFVRIHRSALVNADRVRELQPLFHGEYAVVLANGTRLKLSRTYRSALDRLLPR